MKTPDFDFDFSKRNAADDVIDALVERVLAAYPPDRIARIKSRTAWTWNSASAKRQYDDRVTYLVTSPGEPDISPDLPCPKDATDIQGEMIWQLKGMLNNSVVDCEYFPGFSSGCEQATIPSLFGCVKERASNSEHVKPILQSPADVWSLPAPEIREGFVCHDMLRRMAYKHRRTGGKIPVYMTDVQGPFSSAAQIWGIQDFLCDLNEHEKEAHHLLSLCTDAIINFFRAMWEVAGDTMVPMHCMPVYWIPKDCGVAVSDDFFAVVGRNTVENFSVPYLERIGAAFGGVTAHTCGSMNHLPEAMNRMKTLRAVNFSTSETDLRKYAAESDPRITILTHKGGLSCNGLPILNTVEHIAHCAKTQRDFGVKVFASVLWSGAPADEANRRAWEAAARL